MAEGMGNRFLLLLVLVAFLGACTDESRVWIAMDINTGEGSHIGLMASHTSVFDPVNKDQYLDSFAEDWQKWRLTYDGKAVCDLVIGENEALVGFWATDSHLYAHKRTPVDLAGNAEQRIVRFDRKCREEVCGDLAEYIAGGEVLQFRDQLGQGRVTFDKIDPPSPATVVEIEIGECSGTP